MCARSLERDLVVHFFGERGAPDAARHAAAASRPFSIGLRLPKSPASSPPRAPTLSPARSSSVSSPRKRWSTTSVVYLSTPALVLPLARLQLALDVNLRALLQVLLGDLGEVLVIDDDRVPLGALLPLAGRLVAPAFRRRDPQVDHLPAVVQPPHSGSRPRLPTRMTLLTLPAIDLTPPVASLWARAPAGRLMRSPCTFAADPSANCGAGMPTGDFLHSAIGAPGAVP